MPPRRSDWHRDNAVCVRNNREQFAGGALLLLVLIATVLSSAPAPVAVMATRTVPLTLPAALTRVRDRLEASGYTRITIDGYAAEFEGIAPTAPTQVRAAFRKPHGGGAIDEYYAQLRRRHEPDLRRASIRTGVAHAAQRGETATLPRVAVGD